LHREAREEEQQLQPAGCCFISLNGVWSIYANFGHCPNLDVYFEVVEVMPFPDLRGAVKPLGFKTEFYRINDLFCLVIFFVVS